MSRKTQQAEIEIRRKKVAANLTAGLNYRDIAGALDVSLATVAGDVKTILKRWRAEQVSTIDQWVQLESHRLDRAINAIWEKVNDGDLNAIDRALKIMERRAKLLGLDTPSVTRLEGADGGPIQTQRVPIDLDKLSEDDVRMIIALQAKAAVTP